MYLFCNSVISSTDPFSGLFLADFCYRKTERFIVCPEDPYVHKNGVLVGNRGGGKVENEKIRIQFTIFSPFF
jgi:hypothetical protein